MNWNEKAMKIKLGLILLSMCLSIMGCKKEKNRICEIYSTETGYAIGAIQSFTTSPFRVTYKYDYSVNGVDYNGKEKAYGIGQKDESLIGNQFLVIYERKNPSNSDLNLNYLIETEQDFEELKTEFSSAPPSPDFPRNCE